MTILNAVSFDQLIAQCLSSGASIGPAEARILLEHATGREKTWLIAHGNEQASDAQAKNFRDLTKRRYEGEPIAYLTAKREFFGLNFFISSDVLIPRADTEKLVEAAVQRVAQNGQVLELGTGSGCIACALASQRPDLTITATDVTQTSVAVATKNTVDLGLANRVKVICTSWFDGLDLPPLAAIVSNPPYIAQDDIHLDRGDLRFEPTVALTDNHDGLFAIKIIVAGAPSRLMPMGWLMIEHGWNQGLVVRNLLTAAGFTQTESLRDLAGHERITLGQWLL